MNASDRFPYSFGVCTAFSILLLPLLVVGCRGPEIARRFDVDGDECTPRRTASRLLDTALPSKQRSGDPATVVPASQNGVVQQTQLIVPVDEESPGPDDGQLVAEPTGKETYPIDLPTALGLAGANNLQIAFAAERVREAAARMDQAEVLWVPSLNAGLIYNNHAGRLQETEGRVVEISRNSLFAGAGAVMGGTATAGGASGPARMVVDLPLVDVLFEPLAARQLVRAAREEHSSTFNDALLQVAGAHLNLLRAHSKVAIAQEAVDNAEELAKITADFAREGEGLEADAQRLQVELNSRRRDLYRAKELVAVTSAELVRLLRLDPTVTLVPIDAGVAPMEIVDNAASLPELLAQAQTVRPEVARVGAIVEETRLRYCQERWRPWVPNLYAGLSGGGFGGGEGSAVRSFSDRTDFDMGAVWEWKNLGLGNSARQRERASVHRQAHLATNQVRDLIASEVNQTYHQVRFRREQIDVARPQVTAALKTLELNLDGIRGRTLRPIEAQQAIAALAAAREQYLDSVIDFNVAQFALVRAIGNPPSVIRNQ